MNTRYLRFGCPGCGARIKAPSQLSGKNRKCPSCGKAFVVPGGRAEARPMLVLREESERFFLSVRQRSGKEMVRTNTMQRKQSA